MRTACDKQQHSDCNTLQRTLQHTLQHRHQQKAFKQLSLEQHALPPRPPAPHLATVPLPAYPFVAQTHEFTEKTMNLHTEIITAMCNVHAECNKIVSLRLYVTDLKKPMTLAEFERLQQDSYKYVSQTLKRNWTENLRIAVALPLEVATGSGSWRDLSVSDRDVFDKSPMRSLLRQISFIMEESLRVLTNNSITSYAALIDEIAAFRVDIVSTHTANVTYTPPHPPPFSKDARRPAAVGVDKKHGVDPFFVLDLKTVGGMVNYTTAPEEFAEAPLLLFDAALLEISDIPRLDSLLITKMFLGRYGKTHLTSTTIQDPTVDFLRQVRFLESQPRSHFIY